ncbi:MAG: hypothetical protein ACOVN2_11325, partial [Usitatibacteraceae bacterium]
MSRLARMPDDDKRKRARAAYATMVASSDQMRAELDEFTSRFDLQTLISFALMFDEKRAEHRGTVLEVALWIASVHCMTKVEALSFKHIEGKDDGT